MIFTHKGPDVQFWVFLRVNNGGDGDTEVGDWAPEIWFFWCPPVSISGDERKRPE